MHTLHFLLGLSLDNDVLAAVRKTVALPFQPFNGLYVETDTMTLEVSSLGYSLVDNAFYCLIENETIEQAQDLEQSLARWKQSGFEEVDVAVLVKKLHFL